MEHTADAISTRSWLLDRYGPTMTHREVADALKFKPETLRRKMWAKRGLPWIQALWNARCQHEGRDRVYRTTLVAHVIDGTYPDSAADTETPTVTTGD